jgi:O-antigen/teichoic acid export membrane protein
MALMGVLFPAFASVMQTDRDRAISLFSQTVRLLLFILFPVTLALLSLAGPILHLWLGEEFVAQSTRLMQILTLGVLINSLAQVPSGLIQSVGRPDLTARLHLLELPLYLALLWWSVQTRGITGAALAWTLRVSLDAAALFWLAERCVPGSSRSLRNSAVPMAGVLAAMAAGMLLRGLLWQAIYVAAVSLVFVVVMWRGVLGASEKRALTGLLPTLRISKETRSDGN